MKNIIYILIFLFSFKANSQTTSITCWHQKIDTVYCPTCVDQVYYELFTGIKVETIDSVYTIYMPYKVYDEDTFYVIQDVYNTNIFIGQNTVSYSSKFEIAERIKYCLGDSSVVVGSSCSCCDSLLYFKNDSLAHVQGSFNKNDYYLFKIDNDYGWKWGTLKKILEDVGFFVDLFSGIVTALDANVGFNGRDPRCKFNPPSYTLPIYKNDSLAKVAGLTRFVDYYRASNNNSYGMPYFSIVQVTEP